MAIDSAEKRRSISGIPFFMRGPGVTPNSLKDAEWRQEAGYTYSGIVLASGAVVAVVAISHRPMVETRVAHRLVVETRVAHQPVTVVIVTHKKAGSVG